MTKTNQLVLRGNVSSLRSEEDGDGGILYSFRVAVPNPETGRNDFFDVTAHGRADEDPFWGLERGDSAEFICELRDNEAYCVAVKYDLNDLF